MIKQLHHQEVGIVAYCDSIMNIYELHLLLKIRWSMSF